MRLRESRIEFYGPPIGCCSIIEFPKTSQSVAEAIVKHGILAHSRKGSSDQGRRAVMASEMKGEDSKIVIAVRVIGIGRQNLAIKSFCLRKATGLMVSERCRKQRREFRSLWC